MANEEAPLRPLRFRMAVAARAVGKPQFVLEKDYALGYLLAGISAVPGLRDLLVFKGGTCLRKAYFPGYRFSEDLDFTARHAAPCDVLLKSLTDATELMASRLLAFGPFEVVVEKEKHREPHPRGQCTFRVRVRFPWMREPNCSLKVEISSREPLLAGAVERHLIHEFPHENLEVAVAAYRLEEIAAEKLRAFLQSRQHLREQGWLRNRPRDLYDLWYLYLQQAQPVDWSGVRNLVIGKAEAYGIAYDRPEDFLDELVLQGIRRDWDAQLATFVVDLPSFEACAGTFRAVIEAVFT